MYNIIKIETLKSQIKQLTSNSQLPIEIIYFLFKSLTNQLEILYQNEFEKQINLSALDRAREQLQEKKNKQKQEKSQESQD